jgi:hypothetical protein
MRPLKNNQTSVRHYPTRAFIDALIEEVDDGQCFVPFLGSGISSASGIIMGMEFTNYLAHVTRLVIAGGHPAHSAETKATHYRLFESGWPPLPEQTEINSAIDWIDASFRDICDRTGWIINRDTENNVQSLERRKDHPEDPVSASLSQPPIPLVIRSRNAAPQVETLERLKRMFEWRYPGAGSGTPAEVEDYFMQETLTQEERIREKAIRGLSDWKSTLTFLSRVNIDKNDRLSLGDEQQSIIDAFNQFITRGRQPNLSHQMIAHLSMPMRFHSILSTNFDDLTETAFKDQGIPLAIMAVSTTGGLPSHHAVAAQDTLVKLHGHFHETRADKSLDEEPNEVDKATFAAYMQRGKGHPHHAADDTLHAPTDRLLVIGYSGSDHRCVQLIRHWLENTTTHRPDDALVYWICHNDADVSKVQRLFRSESLARRIIVTENSRPDYLLFELYQKLCYALPPGSNAYAFPHATPPYRARLLHSLPEARRSRPRQSSKWSRDDIEFVIRECILSCVNQQQYIDETHVTRAVRWSPRHRCEQSTPRERTTAWLINASTVVASAAALAYEELTRNPTRKVLWFELNDLTDADGLFRDIIRTLSVRCGRFPTQHVALHPAAVGSIAEAVTEHTTRKTAALRNQSDRIARYIRELLRDYRVSPESVVLMLYGREGYGRDAGIVTKDWREADFTGLHTVIEGLSLAEVTVIYFPLTSTRANNRLETITRACEDLAPSPRAPDVSDKSWEPDPHAEAMLDSSGEVNQIHHYAEELSQVPRIANQLFEPFLQRTSTNTPVAKTLTKEDHEFLQWLYALSLFRQSRHPSALFSEAAYPPHDTDLTDGTDNDFLRYETTQRWMMDLEALDIFHAKPGGALWAHRDIRTIIRTVSAAFKHSPEARFNLSARTSAVRYRIGDWYQRAFFSSGHIQPLIEAIHHFVESALTAQEFEVTSQARPNAATLARIRARRFIVGFTQAQKTLLIGWESLKYWQSSATDVSWLGGPCRADIRKKASRVRREIFKPSKSSTAKGYLAGSLSRRCRTAVDDFITTLEIASTTMKATGSSAVAGAGLTTAPRRGTQSRDPVRVHKTLQPLHYWHALGASDAEFHTLFKEYLYQLSFPLADLLIALMDSNAPRTGFAKLKGALIDSLDKRGSMAVCDILHVLAECAFLMLRRAKAARHAQQAAPLAEWVTVSRYCDLGLDMCKHLPAEEYVEELSLEALFHQICSVALANLGRFQEARRHLTDSQSTLARSSQKTRTDQAIAAIRHAEVAITEAFWIKDVLTTRKHSWAMQGTHEYKIPISVICIDNQAVEKQMLFAPPIVSRQKRRYVLQGSHSQFPEFMKRHFMLLLDESVAQLTRAEHLLRGASHSAHWWFQLHLLRLRSYGLLQFLETWAFRSLVLRQGTLDEGIKDSFIYATRVADEEPFRLLRCVQYYSVAVKTSVELGSGKEEFYTAFRGIAGKSADAPSRDFIHDVIRKGVEKAIEAAYKPDGTPAGVLRSLRELRSESLEEVISGLKNIVCKTNTRVSNLLVKGWAEALKTLSQGICCTSAHTKGAMSPSPAEYVSPSASYLAETAVPCEPESAD